MGWGAQMPVRERSLSTTMLTSVVSAVFLMPMTASAADLNKARAPVPAAYAPAVDGVNWKFGGLGGSLADRPIYGAQGAVTIPLAGQYGFQLDGAVGSFDDRFFGIVAGHLFWRNPAQGLVGVYVSHTHWDQFTGLHVTQVGGEAEAYFGPFTIQGIAGVETGNSASGNVGGLLETYDVGTRFFDKINLSYYLNDNLKVFAGHRYQGGKNALALGGEWAFRLNGPVMGALFVEGRVGENDFRGIWGGLRVYYGQNDKTLVQRHRQDDPNWWIPESLFSIVNTLVTKPIPGGGPHCVPEGDAEGDACCPQPDGDGDGDGRCVVVGDGDGDSINE